MTGPAAVELTVDDARIAATHGCVESIRSGVTTLVDFMYVHPRPGLTRAVINAYEQTGMRGVVCRGFLSDGVQDGGPPAPIHTAHPPPKHPAVLVHKDNRPREPGPAWPSPFLNS